MPSSIDSTTLVNVEKGFSIFTEIFFVKMKFLGEISPVPELSFLPAPYRGWTRAGEKRVQDNFHAHAQSAAIFPNHIWKYFPDSGLRSRDGAMVRALASHQCGLGSIPGPSVIYGLSLLLVLYSAPRGFSPGTPVFPSPQKPAFPNSNSIWNARTLLNEFLWTPWSSVGKQITFTFTFTFGLWRDFLDDNTQATISTFSLVKNMQISHKSVEFHQCHAKRHSVCSFTTTDIKDNERNLC